MNEPPHRSGQRKHGHDRLLGKSRPAIFNAMGVRVTKEMDTISLAFTRSR
jgi:hypothetical protein